MNIMNYKLNRFIILCLLMVSFASAKGTDYQRWWGFYDENSEQVYVGTNTAETYNCAVSCASSNEFLNGATIHGVRFYLRDKTNISDVVVWLSVSRPASADQADIAVVNVPQTQLVDFDHDHQMVEVELPQPYTMESGKTILVGFSFKVNSVKTDADKKPLVIVKQNVGKGAFMLRTSKSTPSWNELGAMSDYGALTLEMLVSNPSLPTHSVDVSSLTEAMGVKNAICEPSVTIASSGFAIVSSIDYELTVAGQSKGTTHLELDSPIRTAGQRQRLPLSITLPATNGYADYQLKVVQVNGEPNEAESPQQSALLLAVDKKATRRSVVEEYTGTWCPNCPRGIVGMSNMERDFGDRFIGIAIHQGNDPMTVSAFSSLNSQHNGAPTCEMDRVIECDPYLGDDRTNYHYHASTTFGRILSRVSEADLSLTASWTDAGQTHIAYKASTTFYLDNDVSTYALAFVLTADGLRGSTSQWYQANAESGRNTYSDDDMAVFRDAPNPVTDIEYNHVAIGGTAVDKGISGSISQPIVSGHPQTYNGSFSLTDNPLVQDKSRLHAIVLLINNATGQIVNAAKADIMTPGESTGVLKDGEKWNVESGRCDDRPVIYDLQGRRLSRDTTCKGIYIVRSAKGRLQGKNSLKVVKR